MAIKFKGVDFIEMDTRLSDDERLVRDNTRRFIALSTAGLRRTRHYNNPVSAVEE
jgi:hypothetical protein